MRLVPVNSIKEGSILAKTIYNSTGVPLLREGYPLNKRLIDRALDNGVYSLYIHDKYSDEIIEDVISPELRQKAVRTLKDTFRDMHNDMFAQKTRKFQKNEKSRQSVEQITSLAKTFVDDVLSNRDVIVNLVDIKTMDDYTYQHCVNTAVLSIVLGLGLGYSRKALESVAAGALLHDFGKVFVSKELLLKPDRLTDDEMEHIKNHPKLGYDYLKETNVLDGIALSVILEHHEKADGTGYPEGRNTVSISPYAKLLSICDVYDALTSDRPYRAAMSPNEALELIMGSCGDAFDLELVKNFIERIVPYPVGSMVELSNNKKAVIHRLNPEYALRPVVKVIVDESGDDEVVFEELDLLQKTDVVITNIYREEQIS
ncbi:MAG TPA: HD family phosphohydrolase [Eubacteriaceae bacterium]|nr:HD family phosphohydrolase [Eubacteriaceae bacterium]